MTTYADHGLCRALHAPASTAAARELAMFAQFVGSWDLAWFDHNAGTPGPAVPGELHFGWVLGGQAIQDVWIVPGRGRPGYRRPPRAFHGSTIRFYDPRIEAWRSTWVEPVNGRVRRFIGRPRGADIELISLEGGPLLRWTFTDIGPTSFTWLGECSTDEGRRWRLEERMVASRRPSQV